MSYIYDPVMVNDKSNGDSVSNTDRFLNCPLW